MNYAAAPVDLREGWVFRGYALDVPDGSNWVHAIGLKTVEHGHVFNDAIMELLLTLGVFGHNAVDHGVAFSIISESALTS